MASRRLVFLLVLASVVGFRTPAGAQEPSPELRAAAGRVVALLKGEAQADAIFAPTFLAAVPPAQVRTIVAQLTGQYGAARAIGEIHPQSSNSGLIDVGFERAVVHMTIVVDPQEPPLISGLLITGADMNGDSFGAIMTEARSLPGQTTFAVARLGDGAPALQASIEPDRPMAIGSSFKLFILAELDRQIRAGQRHWNDVVTIDRHSIPSGILQNWPIGSPVTLHTLASLMISISDNSAADLLLHVVGRANVEQMMARIGVSAAARNRPMLSTIELATIKTAPEAALAAWRNADKAGRRRLLATSYAAPDPGHVDVALFAGNPRAIDVEWYASAADMVRTMDWLRRESDETTKAILAINGGVGAALHAQLAYVGYKGGSEPGVLNLTWLVRNRAGVWYVVTASWNNPAARVDESRFVSLIARAIQLIR
jgi:beta-lactamase class A